MLRVYLPVLGAFAIAVAGAIAPLDRLVGVDVATLEARYEAAAVAQTDPDAPSVEPTGDRTIVAAIVPDAAGRRAGN